MNHHSFHETLLWSNSELYRVMRKFKIQPRTLSGNARRRHSTRLYDTFKVVSDPYDYFRKAMKTELEHGRICRRTNVTKDNTLSTAKIVAAHLCGVEYDEPERQFRWFPAYYDMLWHGEKTVPKIQSITR